jgi:hypothetical protein
MHLCAQMELGTQLAALYNQMVIVGTSKVFATSLYSENLYTLGN